MLYRGGAASDIARLSLRPRKRKDRLRWLNRACKQATGRKTFCFSAISLPFFLTVHSRGGIFDKEFSCAFFAKKKDKKKKGAVKIEDVGQVLERKARRQEEYDQQSIDGGDKRGGEEDGKRVNNNTEESEWIEYGDSNQGRLEGLRIKDMGVEAESVEVENNDSDEGREAHETRTWGQPDEQKKKEKEEPEHAVSMSDKQMAAAYKPPAQRKYVPPTQKVAPIDVMSDALFPSLADASKIEKTKKEESKAGGGWTKAGATPAEIRASSGPRVFGNTTINTTTGTGRDSALAAVKAMAALNSTPAPVRQPEPVLTAAPAAEKGPSKYIPPHLRAKN
ncbi:unnamed protein product [Caenorhabditis auriculariae]|uniref:Uncharacterized protein n=1 Tax=Caenorhabditis auriculariae TaxID=2777116 RepID=A0A8S1GXS4_9PELO|nr:unnamed protein product [Caenorhabditis auriculariae]